ncbi:MAG: mercury(II) reductase [Thermoplasmata archaeon]
MKDYDLIILGGGSAAFSAAIKAVEFGAHVMIIENNVIGGTCVNRGCIPSKNLLWASSLFGNFAINNFKQIKLNGKYDLKKLIEQKDALVSKLRKEKYENLLGYYPNIQFVKGTGKFDGQSIKIADRTYSARKYIIATGSLPHVPGIDGISKINILTSNELLNMSKVPESIGIIGGGYIALEMSMYLSWLGSKVTIFERGERLLKKYDADMSEAVEQYLNKNGVKILKNVTFHRVGKLKSQNEIDISVKRDSQSLFFEALLAASGRIPNTENIGLNTATVTVDDHDAVIIDKTLKTSNPDIYAAGDVTGLNMLVTVAAKQGAVAAENALFGQDLEIDYNLIPYAIYTDPQIAGVGLLEEQAKKKNIIYNVRTLTNVLVPKANTMRHTAGFVKMLTDKEDHIIGFHGFAPYISEFVSEATLAIKYRMTPEELAEIVHPYPTMSESLKMVAQSFSKDMSRLSCCAE